MSRSRIVLLMLVAVTATLVACTVGGPGGGGALPPPVDNSAGSLTDPTHLPLGDYHVSTVVAAPGSIYTCSTASGGGGAAVAGPWIHADGTWDATSKISVQGAVAWPTANVSITESAGRRIISGNSLPDHTTGIFPIQPSDPAYAYDRNPNSIGAHTVSVSLPLSPAASAQPHCLPMGPIGYALNGVPIYNGLDAESRDAKAHEIQDSCDGHPSPSGYHYHSESDCMPGVHAPTPTLIGYALDGFGIYNSAAADGSTLTNDDLDECHGTTSAVPWNGSTQSVYHYVATQAYPYTLGCFRGTPGG
jgi:hypothetical protein